jgi:hypothetical protein
MCNVRSCLAVSRSEFGARAMTQESSNCIVLLFSCITSFTSTAWLAQSVERTTLSTSVVGFVRSRVRAPHWVEIFFCGFRAFSGSSKLATTFCEQSSDAPESCLSIDTNDPVGGLDDQLLGFLIGTRFLVVTFFLACCDPWWRRSIEEQEEARSNLPSRFVLPIKVSRPCQPSTVWGVLNGFKPYFFALAARPFSVLSRGE